MQRKERILPWRKRPARIFQRPQTIISEKTATVNVKATPRTVLKVKPPKVTARRTAVRPKVVTSRTRPNQVVVEPREGKKILTEPPSVYFRRMGFTINPPVYVN